MEKITSADQMLRERENGNEIFVDISCFSMKDSEIELIGSNNKIYFISEKSEKLHLEESKITIKGDNNIIIVMGSRFPIKVCCTMGHGCSIFIGKNFWATNSVYIMVNEMSNVYIGEWCLFARDIWIRTSDMHLIYDTKTKERINYNKDVYVGEHVWVGQDVCLLKGSVVGNGSIVGMRSLCSSTKTMGVNASYAGTPAKILKNDIMWRHKGSNQITVDEVLDGSYDEWDNEKYIYEQEEMDRRYAEYEKVMSRNPNVEEKIQFLLRYSNK